MNLFVAFFLFTTFNVALANECKPHSPGVSELDLAVLSPVTVVAKLKKKLDGSQYFNATASVKLIFGTHTGGLKKGTTFTFGPLGKEAECMDYKSKSTVIMFLESPDSENFFAIAYNPIKYKKRTGKMIKKLLCKGCLVAPAFKKPKAKKNIAEGKGLKIQCKFAKKPNPKPTINWYFNGKLLTKSDKKYKISASKKRGTLRVKKLSPGQGGKYVCSARSVASATAANFTTTVIVTPFCHDCPGSFSNYCIKDQGQCCFVKEDNFPSCRCYPGFGGARCGDRILSEKVAISNVSYANQQRLIAIMGMCIALMLITFFSISIYCLFKKKRNDFKDQLLREFSPPTESKEFHGPISSSEHRRLIESDGPLNKSQDVLAIKGLEVSNRDSYHLDTGHHRNSSTNSEGSSGAAVVDEPHFRQSHISTQRHSGLSQQRSRLNGLAKHPRHSSGSLGKHEDNQRFNMAPLQRQEALGSSDPISSHIAKPNLPLNSHLTSFLRHSNSSIPSSNYVETEPNKTDVHYNSNPINSPKNHRVTTFNSDGGVQHEELRRDDGDLSSVTPHSPISSTENEHIYHQLSETLTGANMSPRFIHSQPNNYTVGDTSIQNRDYENHIIPNQVHVSSVDQDDPFNRFEVPNTSLGLNGKFPHKEAKYVPCPEVSKLPYKNATVASAQLHHLSLLSKQKDFAQIDTDLAADTLSISSGDQSAYESDNTDSDHHSLSIAV